MQSVFKATLCGFRAFFSALLNNNDAAAKLSVVEEKLRSVECAKELQDTRNSHTQRFLALSLSQEAFRELLVRKAALYAGTTTPEEREAARRDFWELRDLGAEHGYSVKNRIEDYFEKRARPDAPT